MRARSRWRRLPLLSTWLVIGLALCLPMHVHATQPPMVDGKPMMSLAPMLAHVTPAVVNISSTTHIRVRDPYFNDPLFRRFFGGGVPRERIEQSLGSGVIVNAAKGYILTNNHVVSGADAIKVTLHDGRHFKATLVGADPDTDIAVLKIPADDLTQLPLADSSKTRVGDFVAAVGNPFGLGQSVTYGIVSALGRTGLGDTYQNFIQTDAAINPGNSGGALVNMHGELIGINSMIYSPSGANAGIGFAIPSNLAIKVMRQLLTYGKVRRGNLGVHVQKLTPNLARVLGVDAASGAVVTSVEDGSPADKAGVQPGDLVVAINDTPVHTPRDLHNAEGLLPVGSDVQLTVRHDGRTRTFDMRMAPEQLAHASGGGIDPRLDGAALRDTSSSEAAQTVSGVVVDTVDKGSRAGRNGLRKGDVIIGVNQRRTPNLATLKALLAGPPPRQLMLIVARQHRLHYLLMH
ncbi:MAG TPA: DegQ family serine endoprotease [Oleiagrimonas sp.]|nr:DegQ family serine endoprotease [Oleiagrimonas sp.]